MNGRDCSSQRITQLSSSLIYYVSTDLGSGETNIKTIEEVCGGKSSRSFRFIFIFNYCNVHLNFLFIIGAILIIYINIFILL